jgi:hypothetical protein
MLKDHWVLTLLLGDAISLVLLMGATVLGFRIARRWDSDSSSELQLSLERESYLVSTIITYVFGFELLSLWLFIVSVNDHFPPLIRGAMCGTGSLNANQFGWLALGLKIAEFVLLSLWLSLHLLDRRVPEYPLTKEKFFALLVLAPLVIAAAVVQLLYVLNIDPSIITTCCSVTFGSFSANGIGSAFATKIDERVIVASFMVIGIAFVATNVLHYFDKGRVRTVTSFVVPVVGPAFGAIALFVVTHHYAKYVYGLPSHHCPFDMLWWQYYFVGYAIYGLLAAALISSLIVGVMSVSSRKQLLHREANRMSGTASMWGATSSALLLILLEGIEVLWKANV